MVTYFEFIVVFLITLFAIFLTVMIFLKSETDMWIKPEYACPLYKDSYAYYLSDIKSAVQKHDLSHYTQNPEALVAGLITAESSWDENAKKKEPQLLQEYPEKFKGDITLATSYGLMQVIPGFHSECDKEMLISDPAYNIDCGVGILARYVADCGGDIRQGLTKYNTGTCTGRTRPVDYVQKILAYQAAFETCLLA